MKILITGSGSGIGRATALALAEKGHSVLATTHNALQAKELQETGLKKSLDLKSFVLDITNVSDRKKILDYDIDALINNAAVGETGSLAEIDMNKVRNSFEVNVFSTFELSQLALRSMIKKDSGKIIFISSVLGRVTSPFFGPYSMTKFALSSGAEMLRNEMSKISDSISIVVVEPGAYHTGFNQKMIATKFEWMKVKSYFSHMINELNKSEKKNLERIEETNLNSIVQKIVTAVESDSPRLRYSAPWWQAFGVRVLRVLGW
jgi:short-subunit dehydrogenase